MENSEKEKSKSTPKPLPAKKFSAKIAGELLGLNDNRMFVVEFLFKKELEAKTLVEWKKIFKARKIIKVE